MRARYVVPGIVLAASAMLLLSQPSVREKVGMLPSGGFLLNSGWTITAAGTQIPVDTFPMASVVSADKKYLLVLNGGYNPPTVSVIDIASAKRSCLVPESPMDGSAWR